LRVRANPAGGEVKKNRVAQKTPLLLSREQNHITYLSNVIRVYIPEGFGGNCLHLCGAFCYYGIVQYVPEGGRIREMARITEELLINVKKLIIDRLKLEEIAVDDIDTDAPLFGEGLGLDSIDALELVIGLEKEYGVSIPDAEVGRAVFQSVRTIAQYIVDNQGATVAAADGAP
jgi:acyl carrier protein